MREHGYSPEPLPHQETSPEDQKIVEQFNERERQRILEEKKVEKPDYARQDYADPSKKTLKTRHAGPVAKLKRGAKKLSEKLNKPAMKIRLEKKWDHEDKKDSE